jgi:methylmalonyl-CoA carboxyltransferase large subunit
MKTESPDGSLTTATLDAILQELNRLNERVAALEARAAAPRPAAPESTPVSATPAPAEEVSEEVLLVIGAAVAAFLGKKAHVRQVRLLGSHPWAQQGRVTIQASHQLEGGGSGRRLS